MEFLLPWSCIAVPFHCLKWRTQVSSSMIICDSKFSPPVSQKISDNCFPCPFACICQNSWHPTSTDFWIAELFSNCITLPLPMDSRNTTHLFLCDGHCVSVHEAGRCCKESVQSKCSRPFVWSVMKCCSPCLSVLTPSYLSSSGCHNHTSLTMHFWQMFINASQLLTFSSHKCYRCSLFQLHPYLCQFRIDCGDAIYWVKQLQLTEHNRECSMISLM
jgi:hypothetical protein